MKKKKLAADEEEKKRLAVVKCWPKPQPTPRNGWRDRLARAEDESSRFVMPDHVMLDLARGRLATLCLPPCARTGSAERPASRAPHPRHRLCGQR